MKKLSIRLFAVILCICCLAGSLSAAQVPLAPGNHVRWIDRIDKPVPDYATQFYNWLEANMGTGGILCEPTAAELVDGRYYAYRVTRFDGSITFTYNAADPSTSGQAFNDAISKKHRIDEVYTMLYAVYKAFQQDHPEVFWLSGETRVSFTHNGGSYRRDNGTAYGEYNIDVIFILRYTSGEFDIRDMEYCSTAAILNGIALRDNAVADYLTSAEITGAKTRYDQVRALNNMLTSRNCYNSDSSALSDEDKKALLGSDIYSCISALEGRTGKRGPVCAGYSEAFKVLCDKLGIPCVLVTGDADGGYHQWNYVQMDDGNWYAVDVTWNDPTIPGKTSAVSGSERETYLLIGSDTQVSGSTFSTSHIVTNKSGTDCYLSNGPCLSRTAYDPAGTQPIGSSQKQNVVLGNVLHTDIKAYIDNRPIRSFNINNNTYIVVEDLFDYGFGVTWDGDARTLTISTDRTAMPLQYTASYVHPAVSQPNGSVAMPYYYTDITTWIGTSQVVGYNIGGFTCICMDDLAAFFSTGYVWDGAERSLRLSTVA